MFCFLKVPTEEDFQFLLKTHFNRIMLIHLLNRILAFYLVGYLIFQVFVLKFIFVLFHLVDEWRWEYIYQLRLYYEHLSKVLEVKAELRDR